MVKKKPEVWLYTRHLDGRVYSENTVAFGARAPVVGDHLVFKTGKPETTKIFVVTRIVHQLLAAAERDSEMEAYATEVADKEFQATKFDTF